MGFFKNLKRKLSIRMIERKVKKLKKKVVIELEDTGVSDAFEELLVDLLPLKGVAGVEGLMALMEEVEPDDIDDDVRKQAMEFVEDVIEYFGIKYEEFTVEDLT